MQKILIIDDNSIITRALKMLLSSSESEIYEAIGGAEGIRLFNEILPDIVITDMEMPNVSGEEVIASIRKTKGDQIILAMSARENNQKIAMLAGATQFYLKPIIHTDIIPYMANH